MKTRIAIALSITITSAYSAPANATSQPSVITLAQGSDQTPQERMKLIQSTKMDAIKVQSATRVQAGKFFEVKLVSKKDKVNGVCWLNWALSKGFDTPRDFKMIGGLASVKLLPIETGAGKMSFYCGTNRSDAAIGGSRNIYIAP
jgi:hypothetical protein